MQENKNISIFDFLKIIQDMIPQLAEKRALLSETQQQKVLHFVNHLIDEEDVLVKNATKATKKGEKNLPAEAK